jgi:hypothetical protein
MNLELAADEDADIKRVGKSGQISLGKEHSGQYYREHLLEDGTIVLVPVVVVPRSHWSVRDAQKIRRAIAWAAKNPAAESDLETLISNKERGPRVKRGQ